MQDKDIEKYSLWDIGGVYILNNTTMNNLPFQTEKFNAKWSEWIEFRKERKLPKYVPTGLKKTFANLFNISNGDEETACKIIDQSIIHNWQGLFKLKNDAANNNPTKQGTSAARIEAAKAWTFAGGNQTG